MLAILGAHEAGHYLACRRYGVDASLPFFLPAPLPLSGTFGAFIRIRDVIPHKQALFDIGAAGPFAGFVVAVPVLVVGLWLSRLVPMPERLRDDLARPAAHLPGAQQVLWGALPDGQLLHLHPVARAAWFGLLATALNLFPLTQLDGGHVAYAVFGARSRWITLATAAIILALTFVSTSWVAWAVLVVVALTVAGLSHPPTGNDHLPLGRRRTALALAAAIVFLLCFTPVPVEPIDRLVDATSPIAAPALTPSGRPRQSMLIGSTSIDVRRASAGCAASAPRMAAFIAARSPPFTKNWARCSPRSRMSGAGAGPSSAIGRPATARATSRASAPAASSARSRVEPRTTTLIMAVTGG